MNFGLWNPEIIYHPPSKLINLPTSPVSCGHFTLKIQNVIFNTHFWLSTLSQNCNHDCELTYYIWKMWPHHYLVQCRTSSSNRRYIVFLQMLVALKRAGCDVWKLECQASNVTAVAESDHLLHGHTLPVFFAIDQSHRPPRSAEIQPMSQQAAAAARPCRELVLDTRSCIIPQMW